MKEEGYVGREQTLVKHLILKNYLERFAHIIYKRFESITYVDCFSGPWQDRSADHEDSSFSIALSELRKAQGTHDRLGNKRQIRCFFLEKDPRAYRELEAFAARVGDAEIKTENKRFEESIDAILQFVKQGGPNTFPFFFIDPTGWTGFSLDTISPLLRVSPGEVLINFMTSFIRRFVEQGETQSSFAQLFGSAGYREWFEGLHGDERDDTLVGIYADRVREAGRFAFARTAIVIHPEKARTHFHLIYLTRHRTGVRVFKEIEKKAMAKMESLRADARARKREASTGMGDLFADQGILQTNESIYYNKLRMHYLGKAKVSVQRALRERRRIAYSDAWEIALSSPLVWESDLKSWLEEWTNSGLIEVTGLKGKERTPKFDQTDHHIVWLRP
ncbi:MAG: three-Cys-motif partner protein TcmP [Acidobacteriota bacterium]